MVDWFSLPHEYRDAVAEMRGGEDESHGGPADNTRARRKRPLTPVALIEDTLMFGGTLFVPAWLEAEVESPERRLPGSLPRVPPNPLARDDEEEENEEEDDEDDDEDDEDLDDDFDDEDLDDDFDDDDFDDEDLDDDFDDEDLDDDFDDDDDDDDDEDEEEDEEADEV
jgi:hypothetical protein